MNHKIQKFEDIFAHGDSATVKCCVTGNTVRTLTKQGDNCHLVAGDGTELDIPFDTPIQYEAWSMGSLNFDLNGRPLKFCTELDILSTESGEYTITHPSNQW